MSPIVRFRLLWLVLAGAAFFLGKWLKTARRAELVMPEPISAPGTVAAKQADLGPQSQVTGDKPFTAWLRQNLANPAAEYQNWPAGDPLKLALARSKLLRTDPFFLLKINPGDEDALRAAWEQDAVRAANLAKSILTSPDKDGFDSKNFDLWERLAEEDPVWCWESVCRSRSISWDRFEVIKRVMERWASKDPAASVEAAAKLSWGEGRWAAQCYAVNGIAKLDPQAAITYFTNLPDDTRAAWGLIGVLSDFDNLPAATAVHLLGEQWVNYRHDDDLSKALSTFQKQAQDPKAAAEARGQIYGELGEFRDKVRDWGQQAPEEAMAWAKAFPEPEVAQALQHAMLVGQTQKLTAAEAAPYFANAPEGYRQRMMEDWLGKLGQAPAKKAWEELSGIADPAMRTEFQNSMLKIYPEEEAKAFRGLMDAAEQ